MKEQNGNANRSKIFAFIHRWIPNSPRWLIEHNRIEEAKEILIESAQYNQRMHLIPSNLDELLEQQSAEVRSAPSPAGWWTLWKGEFSLKSQKLQFRKISYFAGERAVRHMVCVHLAWSIYIVTYYGMLLNIRTFSRDHLEINTVVAGKFIEHTVEETNFFL